VEFCSFFAVLYLPVGSILMLDEARNVTGGQDGGADLLDRKRYQQQLQLLEEQVN